MIPRGIQFIVGYWLYHSQRHRNDSDAGHTDAKPELGVRQYICGRRTALALFHHALLVGP